MMHSLASVRALLDAKSYDAARRAVRDLAKQNPNDMSLLELGVEIELASGNYQQALTVARSALQSAPDSPALRDQELQALCRLGKKREAREALQRFEQDFPHHRMRIEGLTLMVDSLHQRVVKIKSRLDDLTEEASDTPWMQRSFGIAYHNINDLFKAQRLMLAAHEHYPDDAELNAALATNSFQLVRPATARKFATLALAGAPHDGRMKFLRIASYLYYLPPFYIFGCFLLIAQALTSKFGVYLSLLPALVIVYCFGDVLRFSWDALSIAAGLPLYKHSTIVDVAFLILFLVVINQKIYDRLFARNRPLKIRKY